MARVEAMIEELSRLESETDELAAIDERVRALAPTGTGGFWSELLAGGSRVGGPPELFAFAYQLECYVPAPRRRHGYFALPLLHGEHFVARADCRADRRAGRLEIRRLTLEPGARPAPEALRPAFEDLARREGEDEKAYRTRIQKLGVLPTRARVPGSGPWLPMERPSAITTGSEKWLWPGFSSSSRSAPGSAWRTSQHS